MNTEDGMNETHDKEHQMNPFVVFFLFAAISLIAGFALWFIRAYFGLN